MRSERKTRTLGVRLTPGELAMLEGLAEGHGRKVAEEARAQLLYAALRQVVRQASEPKLRARAAADAARAALVAGFPEEAAGALTPADYARVLAEAASN